MKTKVSLPEFRISLAAVGRRLASVIMKAREKALTDEEFADTINAVFDSCCELPAQPEVNEHAVAKIVEAEQTEIEKSVRRSAAARKAAERRRASVSRIVPQEETKEVIPVNSQAVAQRQKGKNKRHHKRRRR